ncbi:MAG: aminotransferase class V-fold PLP-dependent enzyme [Duncaniella sp.]|nr:aminotransferase class V-fold PLP-dependent enzyme [Duncaniella sp.]
MISNERILLCKPHLGGEERRFIDEAFADSWVTPLGPHVDGFEEDLKKFLSASDPTLRSIEVAAVSAGTAAIHLALIMLGVGKGDEVICQDMTFAASANPVVYLGATPVFVDSEPSTWNMSPSLLERAIADRIAVTGRKPKAIVMVHLYGMPSDIDAILGVAARYDIPVVEDAAEALGSQYKGRECSTFGRFGVLSFNGNKIITTSGGGAVVCRDAADKKRVLFLATQAREPKPYYHHLEIGYNYRLSNISAAIGRGQMLVLEAHIAHHRMLADIYRRAFAECKWVEFHDNPAADYNANFWLSTILIDPANPGRATPLSLLSAMGALNVETRLLWKPMHMQPVYADAPAYTDGTSESLFSRGLCLPSGPWVTPAQARAIAGEIVRLCSAQTES